MTDLGAGTRRHKVLVSHDSSALLNELRREAAARDREARRQHMMEKRQSYELFMLSLQSWEDSLLDGQPLSAMWEVCRSFVHYVHQFSIWPFPRCIIIMCLSKHKYLFYATWWVSFGCCCRYFYRSLWLKIHYYRTDKWPNNVVTRKT